MPKRDALEYVGQSEGCRAALDKLYVTKDHVDDEEGEFMVYDSALSLADEAMVKRALHEALGTKG